MSSRHGANFGLPHAGDAEATMAGEGNIERIPVCRPVLPPLGDIAAYIDQIDASRRYSNHGGLVLALQDRLRAMTGAIAHVVVAASGTCALTGAILAAAGRPRRGRELCLVPAYTFIGTVSAIEQAGYRPHFIDVERETWSIAPERCLTHRLIDAVGLVVPVAPYGRPVSQRPWTAFTARTGIPVVIDGAASFESVVAHPETCVGSVPVAVSFHATKTFCTAEGGAIFCGDADLWRASLQCLNFGFDLDRTSRKPSINGKMSEYHAAIGLAELAGWPAKRSRFAAVASSYRTHAPVSDIGQLHLSPIVAANYALLEVRSRRQAERIDVALQNSRIGQRRWYGEGAHRHPYCEVYGRDETPVTDNLSKRLIGLPMFVDLSDDDVASVMNVIGAECAAERVSTKATIF